MWHRVRPDADPMNMRQQTRPAKDLSRGAFCPDLRILWMDWQIEQAYGANGKTKHLAYVFVHRLIRLVVPTRWQAGVRSGIKLMIIRGAEGAVA